MLFLLHLLSLHSFRGLVYGTFNCNRFIWSFENLSCLQLYLLLARVTIYHMVVLRSLCTRGHRDLKRGPSGLNIFDSGNATIELSPIVNLIKLLMADSTTVYIPWYAHYFFFLFFIPQICISEIIKTKAFLSLLFLPEELN